MKKIGLIGALLLVLLIGASIMTGRLFDQQLHQMTEELLLDPRVELLGMQTEKGLFSSSGSQQLAMDLDGMAQLVIETRWQTRHFPGWLTYQGDVQLLMEGAGETFNVFEELGIQPPVYQGRADWRKATWQMSLAPFEFQDGSLVFQTTELQMQGVYYYSGQQQASFSVAHMTLEDKGYQATRLDLHNLALKMDQSGSYPWVSGDLLMSLERAEFAGPQGQLLINNPSWSQQLHFDARAFDLALQLDLGEISALGQPLASGKLALKTRDVNGQAMADLLELMGRNPDLAQASEADLEQAMNALDRLLAGSPALLLERLDFSIKAPFVVDQKAVGELAFDGRNLPVSYLQQMGEGQLDPEDLFNRIRLELTFDQIHPGLLMMVGIPPFMVDPTQPEQKLVMENGEVRLNGQLLPF
ncbi:DUF945 family protein [Marinospirillum alkaliphilum]|uniref:Uncharacterized protein n=1 Tax=Marinospirillum alkaliphilum DSM 21637 TaxID=1122209 RepID=A0A1K1V433_9GAMM|nr:DUF945 family protein [Marinospirillum alkaliphilum]SFX19864.1 protein of unknown function [Marinospirillum alkaliphilum DSM 21637]